MTSAGREADVHACPRHGLGMQQADEHHVRVNGVSLLHGRARVACPGCANFIVTGSATVKIGKMPASRLGDSSAHGGTVVFGSPNVTIGGPTAGATLGFPGPGETACHGLGDGRESSSNQQTYGNCGIESTRLIINKNEGQGYKYAEKELLDYALHEGLTHQDQPVVHGETDPATGEWVVSSIDDQNDVLGGTSVESREKLLTHYGVENETVDQSLENIAEASAEGKGVITHHYADVLWGGTVEKDSKGHPIADKDRGTHAINVTGVNYGPDGKIVSVTTADTGKGDCRRDVPVADFVKSLCPPGKMNVTKAAIWP